MVIFILHVWIYAKLYIVNFSVIYSEQLKPCCTRAIFAETTASNQHSTRPEVIFIAVVSQDNPSAHSLHPYCHLGLYLCRMNPCIF